MVETDVQLSVVVLCYRSEETIVHFADKIKSLVESITDSYEIILVGNYLEGSQDATKEIVNQIAAQDSCFKSITKPKNGMMGWDMREGLAHARGRYICVIDGDGQYPIESIQTCYENIFNSSYGLVKTYRKKRGDGLYRIFISKVYNIIFSLLFPKVRSRDVNSKPKMFSRECYERLNLTSDDWFIDAEIMILIADMEIPFFEFPIQFYQLNGRASFVKINAIFEFVKNLIVFRFLRYTAPRKCTKSAKISL